jgi:hypothetical protein
MVNDRWAVFVSSLPPRRSTFFDIPLKIEVKQAFNVRVAKVHRLPKTDVPLKSLASFFSRRNFFSRSHEGSATSGLTPDYSRRASAAIRMILAQREIHHPAHAGRSPTQCHHKRLAMKNPGYRTRRAATACERPFNRAKMTTPGSDPGNGRRRRSVSA